MKGESNEEGEEIHIKYLEQSCPKMEDNKPQVHDLMEEVNPGTIEESLITYIVSLLPSSFKEYIISLLNELKYWFAWNYNEMI